MQPQLLAVDTNFLLDLALPKNEVHEALEIIRERIPRVQIIALSTVLAELSYAAQDVTPKNAARNELAQKALKHMKRDWGITPKTFTDVERDIIESIGGKLRDGGVIPDEERNDSFILAEAALAGCGILVSADHHLLNANPTMLSFILKKCDVEPIVVSSPRDVIKKFGGCRR